MQFNSMPHRQLAAHYMFSIFEYLLTLFCFQAANLFLLENGSDIGYSIYNFLACFGGAFYFAKRKMNIKQLNWPTFWALLSIVAAGVGLGMALAGAVETYFEIIQVKYAICLYTACGVASQFIFDGLISLSSEFKQLPWGKWLRQAGDKIFGKVK